MFKILLILSLFFSGGVMADNHTVISWIEKNCKYGSGAGPELYRKPYKLLDWQKKAIKKMYSPKGEIKIRNLFLIGCRKSAKTSFASLLTIWRLFNKNCGELSSISATNYDQAGIMWSFVVELIKLNEKLHSQIDFKKDVLTHKGNSNTFERFYSSPSVLGKFNNGVSTFDELGIYEPKNWKQIDTIHTSQSLAKDYQNFYLANVAESQTHKSLDVLRDCEADPDWQVIKFVAPEKMKISNRRAWQIANPFLAINAKDPKKFSQVKEYYEKFFRKTKNSPENEALFERLLLGRGCELKFSNFINPKDLQLCQEDVFDDETISWRIGIDLSVTSDSTAWSLVGMENLVEGEDPLQDENRRVYIFSKVYYPGAAMKTKSRALKEKIKLWDSQGYVTLQEGNSTLMRPIVSDIFQFLEDKPLVRDKLEFVFDPSFAASWYEAFSDYPVIQEFYRPKTMTLPTRFLQRKALQKNVFMFEKNPAVEFQAECGIVNSKSKWWCILDRMNDKTQNIDAWVASILATSRLLSAEGQKVESIVV